MAVRYQQPHLASIHDFATKICTYRMTTLESLAAWMKETVIVVDSDKDPHASLVRSSTPALYVNPTKQEILFRAPHSYIDGIGSILILQDLVSLIATLSQESEYTTLGFDGEEVKNLAPVFEIATALEPPGPQDNARGARLMMDFIQSQPSVTLPLGVPSSSEAETQLATSEENQSLHSVSKRTFSLSGSNALIGACKARGITVTHAVHAAIVLATAELSSSNAVAKEEEKSYASIQSANRRSKVPKHFQQHRCKLYNAAFPIIIPDIQTKNFDILAKEIKGLYADNATSEEKGRSQQVIWGFAPPLPPDGAPAEAQTPLLSSLGIVESFLARETNGVEVKGFEFGLDTRAGVVTVYLWSWRGQVSLGATWETGVYGRGVVDGFLEAIEEKLGVGLGIGLEA
jgi:hypothetical protein